MSDRHIRRDLPRSPFEAKKRMTTEFLASRRFRYLCWTAYGLSVLCVSLVGWSFAIALDHWSEIDGFPHSLSVRIAEPIVIFLVNGTLLSGLIIRFRINRNIIKKIIYAILLIAGLIYSFLFVIFILKISTPIWFKIFVYVSFSMASLLYLIHICEWTGLSRRLGIRGLSSADETKTNK